MGNIAFPLLLVLGLSLFLWAYRVFRRQAGSYRLELQTIHELASRLTAERLERQRDREGSTHEESSLQARAGTEESLLPFGRMRELCHGLPRESLTVSRVELLEQLRSLRLRVTPATLQERTRAQIAVSLETPTIFMVTALLFILSCLAGSLTLFAATKNGGWDEVALGAAAAATAVCGALFALLMAFHAHRLRCRFLESLEILTLRDLLPAAIAEVEDASMLESVSIQLEGTSGRLDEIFEQSETVVSRIHASQLAFAEIIDGIRKLTRADSVRQLDQVIDLVNRNQQTTGQLVERIGQLTASLTETQRALADQQGRLARSHAVLGDQLSTLKGWWLIALGSLLGAGLLFAFAGS